jgi:hypothetical protein
MFQLRRSFFESHRVSFPDFEVSQNVRLQRIVDQIGLHLEPEKVNLVILVNSSVKFRTFTSLQN